MERPYEYLRRLALSIPEKEKEKVLNIASQLELYGRLSFVQIDDKPGRLTTILQDNGIFLSEGDKFVISETWDRKKHE